MKGTSKHGRHDLAAAGAEGIGASLSLNPLAPHIGSFTITAMAFQDSGNLDLERLKGCCISVLSADGRLIPFCAYNLTGRGGRSLYRQKSALGAP